MGKIHNKLPATIFSGPTIIYSIPCSHHPSAHKNKL